MGKNVVFRFLALYICLLLLAVVTTGCSSTKDLGDDEYMLAKVRIISDDPKVKPAQLMPYVRQKSNIRKFLIFKQKQVYDTLQAQLTQQDLTKALNNMGYMDASVELLTRAEGKRMTVYYALHPGVQYMLGDVEYDIRDRQIAEILQMDKEENRGLRPGMEFSVEALNNERQRITKTLTDDGYFRFHKDFIRFTADTVTGGKTVDLTLHLNGDDHARYKVGQVNFQPDENGKYHLRRHVMEENSWIEEGKYYSSTALQRTYTNFGRLPIVKYTNIKFTERPDTNLLDCNIQVSTGKANSIIFQPEGTNTAGDFGAAASLTWENRNLFRGSETFSITLRGAYEAIKNLEGYQNSNYQEYSIEAKLQFPRMIAPLLSRNFKRNSTATSALTVSYDMQDRPEFHRRVFSSAWKYLWQNPQHHTRWRIDVLDLNYIYMPWISNTFRKEYLDDVTSRNAILKYNYEDLFIMKAGFGFTYSHRRNSWRVNVETAGNLLNAVSRMMQFHKNSDEQYTLFNIAYAQYAKADVDYTHVVPFNQRNQLVLHADFGIAYPYGNSTILPFDKRYFSGGANSVRGWHVRGLGPGSFQGTDGRIDFINQTGDMKLDLNAEMRTALFWKFNGALFIDAGNIWTIRNYEDQPGGQFRFKNILKQMAVAYGLGIRLNFDYFVVRFDMGMKAVNPAYNTRREHYPIAYPKLSRDFTFHFAVGMPF